jgi:pSer/pThr/pTyr-binding forkhead associated (FHA) protein
VELQLLLLVPLYGFLGALLVFLWMDERRAARGGTAPPPAHLRFLNDENPQAVALGSSNLLGRAADNAICLDDPLVSAHHARISFAGGQWLVEDLGSRNGTRVNDLMVESPIALAAGDILTFGGITLRFEAGAAPDGNRGAAVRERSDGDG